jgi:hypothetical protein
MLLYCVLNETLMRAYIDTGCNVITTRKTAAEELQLSIHPTSHSIRGYAGGITRARGVVHVNLTVALVNADVEAIVVEDHVQMIPVIIGQPFINRTNVTLVVRDNQVRLFEKHLAALPEIDELPPRKLTLWSKETVVIPPHTMGFIAVVGPEDRVEDVYVDGVMGHEPNHEYTIPRCITTTDGVIAVRDLSDYGKEVIAGDLLVRGLPCVKEVGPTQVSVLSVQTCDLTPFQIEDNRSQLGPSLVQEQQAAVLELINEFRDCFALNTKELGNANDNDMHIRLIDDVPVSYRPFR